jgi:hypothetical protein
MTQIEKNLRMAYNHRFPVRIVFKDGILPDAIHLAQPSFQQLIGQHTKPLPQLILELEGLLTPLLGDLRKGGIEVKVPYILTQVDVHHL